jgi:hypothetical protein
MNEAFDLSSVCRTLQRGLANGLWTMENLDEEAPSSALNRRSWAKHPMNKAFKIKPHVNLLRTNEQGTTDRQGDSAGLPD